MYLKHLVKVPNASGKLLFQKKSGTTYIYYEVDRVYDPERQNTYPKRVVIGMQDRVDPEKMQPNENYMKYFPDSEFPDEDERAVRSSCQGIGTYLVIKKILDDTGIGLSLATANFLGTEPVFRHIRVNMGKAHYSPDDRIGRLSLIEDSGERKQRCIVWKCRCDCGGIIYLDTKMLERGTWLSCGCDNNITPRMRDLSRKRFGKLVCMEYAGTDSKFGGACGNAGNTAAMRLPLR